MAEFRDETIYWGDFSRSFLKIFFFSFAKLLCPYLVDPSPMKENGGGECK